jgi:hypothetical protein
MVLGWLVLAVVFAGVVDSQGSGSAGGSVALGAIACQIPI